RNAGSSSCSSCKPLDRHASGKTRDRLRCERPGPFRTLRIVRRSFREPFFRAPIRLHTRSDSVKPALVKSDDERVTRDARAEKIGEPLREIDPAFRAERLAGSKPDERVRRQSLLQSLELRKRWDVEHVTIDERAAPFAVPPKLELFDRVLLLDPTQRFVPARRSERRVQSAQPSIENRSAAPDRSEPRRCSIEDEQLRHRLDLSALASRLTKSTLPAGCPRSAARRGRDPKYV